MSCLHYYYYCPETNAYELDESPAPPKSPSSSDSSQPYTSPFASYPSSPSSDSFFSSSSTDLSYSSSAYHQNASISAAEYEDLWTEVPSRASECLDNVDRSSPSYDRPLSASDSGQSQLPVRSPGIPTPVRPHRLKPLPSTFTLPYSSRVTAGYDDDSNLTQLTHQIRSRPSKAPTSTCYLYGRHVIGACTCSPDVVYHGNPRGHPTPRSSLSVQQIDASYSPNHASIGSGIVPDNLPRPTCHCLSDFPTLSRPYLKSQVPTLPNGTHDSGTSDRRSSNDSEPWCTSCYQNTSSSTRRSPARVPGSGHRKLTKRRTVQKPVARAISPPSVLSDLFPQPLSSTDIAIAKLNPVPIPPLSLDQYLTSAKRRHRLSLRELADREEMANMLHSARPASLPLKQNSPPKKWKTRRINFLSSVSTSSTSCSDSSNNRASTNTEALASLAWNGVVPSTSAPPTKFGRSEESLYSSEHDVSACDMDTIGPRQSTEFNSSWTFATAMADEDVTDEVLVEQLERMRNGSSLHGSGKDHQFHPSLVWMQHSSRHGDPTRTRSISSPNVHDKGLHQHTLARAQTSDFEDATTWPTARRALLCCREIVRTEKRYQDELKALINGETTTPPPALMLAYLPALLTASQALLGRFTEDPSAWGVSTTFMGCEEELEAAMVAWSGVAGQFFSKKEKLRSWKRSRASSQTHGSVPSSPTSAVPPVPSLKSSAGGDGMTAPPPKLVLMGAEKTGEKADADDEKSRRSERKLSVRDLAIQPTQRVMRYAMLYRDLLAHTPQSSPSRALVECALEAAQRIAQKCDLAQNNAAFLPASTSSIVTSQSDSSKNPLRSFMSVVPTRQEN